MELVEESDVPTERVPCQFCNRKFAPKSLAKHAIVCERTLHKKRKTFDSAKQRIKGTELAEFLPIVTPAKRNEALTVSVKEKPTIVHKTMNTAPNVPARKSCKLTSPNKSSNYERCPYCDRTFGPKAFDRHIEWCKEQSVRIETKSSATQEAKERLEARIKYRAPSFRSKRSITREKYSPKSSISDCSSIHLRFEDRNNNDARRKKSLEAELKIKFPEKLKSKEPVKETNFIRQNVLRCSYRPRIAKKTDTKSEKHHSNQNKKKADYSDIQEWISANGTKIKQYPRSSKAVTGNSSVASSATEDYPDPYLLAEHQLKELLGDDDDANEELLNETFVVKPEQTSANISAKEERRHKFQQNKENISCESSGPVKTSSCQTDNGITLKEDKHFKTSPTSAFEKYAPVNGGNRLPVSAAEDFENENFLPPITNAKRGGSQMPHEGHNMNRYPLISLSNLSLCSSVSIDIPEETRKLGTCKSAEVRGNELPTMKRSISASIDKSAPNNKNYVKKNLKMENMLYGKEEPAHGEDPITDAYNEKLEKLNGMLDNGDNFDLSNSFNEFENVLQSAYYDNDVSTIGSESPIEKGGLARDSGDSVASKMSIDSAYNSLNRKSPNAFESQIFSGKTSTPETDVFKSSTLSLSSTDTTTTSCIDANSQNERKLSKFCHECGAKFPLAIAKFCCECGVRRLVI